MSADIVVPFTWLRSEAVFPQEADGAVHAGGPDRNIWRSRRAAACRTGVRAQQPDPAADRAAGGFLVRHCCARGFAGRAVKVLTPLCCSCYRARDSPQILSRSYAGLHWLSACCGALCGFPARRWPPMRALPRAATALPSAAAKTAALRWQLPVHSAGGACGERHETRAACRHLLGVT